MRRLRQVAPWAVSLLLHCVVLALLWRHPPSPALNFAARQPVTVEILHVTKKPAAAPRTVPSPPTPRRPARTLAESSPAASKAERPGPDRPTASDVPAVRAPVVSLLPSINAPGGDLGIPVPADEHGHLIHNTPGELPSEGEKLAQEKRNVKARTEGWANDVLAERRVSNGVVSDYFDGLREALTRATAHPPELNLPYGGSASTKAYVEAMESYGKTGSPTRRADDEDDKDRVDYLADREGAVNPGQMLATARLLRESHRPGITAVIELFQNLDGSVAQLRLLDSSGDRRFDAYVVASAPGALATLSGPSKAGVGIHPQGMHTLWAFTGLRAYGTELARKDIPKAALMGALGALTGGTVDASEVGDFHFTCRVKLLRVY